jgi:hypothetical protein
VGVVQLRSRWLRFWFAPDLIQEQIAIATIVRSGFRGRVGVHDLPFAGAVGGGTMNGLRMQALIAETLVDVPWDEARNVGVLRTLAAG